MALHSLRTYRSAPARAIGLALFAALSAHALPAKPPGRSTAHSNPPAARNSSKSSVAEKGPVRLTLELAETKLHPDDSLWVRLSITNIGKKPFKVDDEAFDSLHILTDLAPSLGLEIQDLKDGKPVFVQKEDGMPFDNDSEPCLKTYLEREARRPPVIPRMLAPGGTISTPAVSWFSLIDVACRGHAEESPRPPYGELGDLFLSTGSYRLRAKYRHGSSPDALDYLKKHGRRPEESWVNLMTDWIQFEVAP